jgi:hypothetical protein
LAYRTLILRRVTGRRRRHDYDVFDGDRDVGCIFYWVVLVTDAPATLTGEIGKRTIIARWPEQENSLDLALGEHVQRKDPAV